jgi:uncharacterized RDD family membrane protein YckC
MDCPQCGEHCCCSGTASGERRGVSQKLLGSDHLSRPIAVGAALSPAQQDHDLRKDDWRNEVANRVQAHRAKRRKRSGDSSMSLSFDEPGAVAVEDIQAPQPVTASPENDWAIPVDEPAASSEEVTEAMFEPQPRIVQRRIERAAARKLIEFPRPAAAESLNFELADPVVDTPRILEADLEAILEANQPEPLRPQPVATVHLDDPAEWLRNHIDVEEPNLETPLPVAPLAARTFSAAIDAGIVVAATAMFLAMLMFFAGSLPQGRLALACIAVIPAGFWSFYQYLFLVFNGSTPGMQMAALELCDFDGASPMRATRICRAAALMLSCMSLGLGFAWAMVDEDSLGWHDRMTKTYLRLS